MSQIEIIKYDFDESVKSELSDNQKVKNLWPIVYIINDRNLKEAYVGETTDGISRMSNHLKNDKKNRLTELRLICSDLFNKSATLDIESNLIKYMHGDGTYNLLNANLGIANHSYYQKDEVYWDLFKDIWHALKSEGVVNKNIEEINNSDLFKYSPYKSLSHDQLESIKSIMKVFVESDSKTIFVEGGAGSGKSILAIYLFKLLYTDVSDLKELDFDDLDFLELLNQFKGKFINPKVALVVPMASFRNTLKKVFKNIKGLSNKMENLIF
jgi:predicted GIY-YIG superfamily endonuclease